MGIVNRRNAALGWVVWQVGKRVARKKAKAVAPTDAKSAGIWSGIATAAAAAVGTLWFLRRHKDGESE